MGFREELRSAINRCSRENGSNTPDYILAEYLGACLAAFELATLERESWYGCAHRPGMNPPSTAPEPQATTKGKP